MKDHEQQHRSHGKLGYVSEFEGFMDRFLETHPQVVREQLIGMNTFWNRDVDFEELDKAREDSAPIKGYQYF